jgi:hypothetical protein
MKWPGSCVRACRRSANRRPPHEKAVERVGAPDGQQGFSQMPLSHST